MGVEDQDTGAVAGVDSRRPIVAGAALVVGLARAVVADVAA